MMKNRNFSGPTNPHQRILLIDIIRGFALFGILLVNAPSLNSPVWMDTSEFAFQSHLWDVVVTNFIFIFVTDKFYPIFSFLFGFSLILFMENALQKGYNAWKLLLRRLIFLFFIGFIHLCLIWWGDILMIYALLGFLMALLFYRLSAQYLLVVAFSLLFALTIIHSYFAYFNWLTSNEEDDFEEQSVQQAKLEKQNVDRYEIINTANNGQLINEEEDMDSIYREGSFIEITAKRIMDYYNVFLWGLVEPESLDELMTYTTYYFHIFAIFLLGGWTQKKKIFQNFEENWPLIKKIGAYLVFIAFITNLLSAHYDVLDEVFYPINGLSLGLVYIFIIVLLYRQNFWKKWLILFAFPGKMSLTVYIGCNLVLSLLFYGYGFGLYGTMGPGTQLWITLTIYFGWFIFSLIWLKYYRFGPLEYLWRWFTYGKV